MTGEREKILGRIREALRVAAPRPGDHIHPRPEIPAEFAPDRDVGRWLPAVGNSFEDRIATFQAQSIELKTDFLLLGSREEMNAKLREIAMAEGWKAVASHHGELTGHACNAVGLPTMNTDGGYFVSELERCDAGITQCDALIAQTGSVVITAKSAGGRALSVLPPHHVVLARREQLLADLPSAFALLRHKYAPDYPSFLSVITGPSRTGDIERILVLGAHGPRKLTVLCF